MNSNGLFYGLVPATSMKRRQAHRLAQLGLAALCWTSCAPSDVRNAKQMEAASSLRAFLSETFISMLDQPHVNQTNFPTWVLSHLNGTNKPAQRVRSACDSVWLNTNYSDWAAALSPLRSPAGPRTSETALVASYQTGSDRGFTGVDFDGRSKRHEGPPTTGFARADFGKAPARARAAP